MIKVANLGYKVVVVGDATGSPGGAHQIGLERMRGAGGIPVSAKRYRKQT